MKTGNFSYEEACKKAIIRFKNTPTTMSLMRHADASEDSPLYCVCMGDFGQVEFLAPKQKAVTLSNQYGNQFLALMVTMNSDPTCPLFEDFSLKYWLICSYIDRRGILLSCTDFESCGGLLTN